MQLAQVRGEQQRLLEERNRLCDSVASRDSQLAHLSAELRSRSATLSDTELIVRKLEATLEAERKERAEAQGYAGG